MYNIKAKEKIKESKKHHELVVEADSDRLKSSLVL